MTILGKKHPEKENRFVITLITKQGGVLYNNILKHFIHFYFFI